MTRAHLDAFCTDSGMTPLRGRTDVFSVEFSARDDLGYSSPPLGGIDQNESDTHNALADEDRLLLSLRVERLLAGRAHSQQPASRSAHVLQAPQVDLCDGQRAEVYTPFTYIESRGEQQIWLAGHWCHRLCREDGAWRIALKRVNLVNAGAAHLAIQLFP